MKKKLTRFLLLFVIVTSVFNVSFAYSFNGENFIHSAKANTILLLLLPLYLVQFQFFTNLSSEYSAISGKGFFGKVKFCNKNLQAKFLKSPIAC